MNTELRAFVDSLDGSVPPPEQNPLLESVWYGLKGSWKQAHEIVQDQTGPDAAWIHAWLHRIEGDLPNAHYWYRCAEREAPTGDTREEGQAIAARLLTRAKETA